MSGKASALLLGMLVILAAGCGGEPVETVGDECIQKVSIEIDVEFLEERDATLIEIGAGRGDLVAAIAQACVEASPDDTVEEVAERAVEILRPEPPPEEM
ncbi:MAG TPA: hypothetical protein VMP42_08610 [Actinomycetota bacterium]|nr:hypothetical protein [Actinomycetota bacterium]